MDKVILKVESSLELINAISHYYKEFYAILSDKKIAKEISEEIRDIEPSRDKLLKRLSVFNSKSIDELNLLEITTLIFQTYQLIREYDILINKIITQINEWNVFIRPDIIMSEVSQTKLLVLSKESSNIGLLLNNFKRQYEEHDVDSLKVLSNYILKKIVLEKGDISKTSTAAEKVDISEIKKIQELFHKYPLSVDVYAILLQTIMDGSVPNITAIFQIIEEDKSFTLSSHSSSYTSEHYKIKPVQNPSLRYFGLIPTATAKPLDELFKNTDVLDSIAGANKKVTDVDKFFNALATDDIAVIYVKKFTANPIEFSIWKLTRIEDAFKYLSSAQNSGLTEGLIERMKIINYTEQPTGANKWKLSDYQIFGNAKTAKSFYIFDSFNGKTFRIIKPWSDNSIRAAKIPRSYLVGFLSFLKIIDSNIKDRISVYNEIQEKVIYERMFLRHPVDVEELLADVQAEMDAPRLKQEIVMILSKFIKSPGNWAELGNELHSPDLLDVFADSIVKLYPDHFKETLSTDKRVLFPFSETISTFLVELNSVKKSFGRHLHEKYTKTPRDIQSTVFKSKDNTFIFIGQILKSALDEVITNKSNVYSTLLMKNKILTVELNESDVDKALSTGGHPEDNDEIDG